MRETQERHKPWLLAFREILWWLHCTPCWASHYYFCIFTKFWIHNYQKNDLVENTWILSKNDSTKYKYNWDSVILCKNSGFSSVPAKMPKKANAARLAMSHAVHSFISLYICTLIAPGGWAWTIKHHSKSQSVFLWWKRVHFLQIIGRHQKLRNALGSFEFFVAYLGIMSRLTSLNSASGRTSRITKLFSFCSRNASFTSTLLTCREENYQNLLSNSAV